MATKTEVSKEINPYAILPAGDIEVKEKTDGTWGVWYLDEAFIPCAVNCNIKDYDKRHKCDRVRKYVESHFGERGISAPEPDRSFEAAMDYAEYLRAGNDEREIKVVARS